MSRSARVAKGVTRVTEKRNITTGRQMNLRLTSLDDDALSLLVERIQEAVPNKSVSKSKVLRAACHLTDEKAIAKLVQVMIENT